MLSLLALSALAAKPPELRLHEGRPVRYDLTLDLDPAATTFGGRLALELTLDEPTKLLWLNARDLQLTEASLEVDGERRPARVVEGGEGTVGLAWKGRVEGPAVLHLAWTGPVVQDGPYGLFHAEASGRDFLYTQLEAMDARRLLPSFDQPDLKTPWSITARVPKGLDVLSNASELSREADGDHELVRFAETEPLPTYLVALAVGPFDAVDAGTAGRRPTRVRVVVPEGRAEEAAWAVEVTGGVLTELEDWFDQPYPFEKLDVVGLPNAVGFAAMEHPGLVTFAQTILGSPPASDTVSRRRLYLEFQAHELSHMWFGNLVTLPWWDELWLNESLASWMGRKTMVALHPEWDTEIDRLGARESAMAADALTTARRIREPISDEGDIEDAFDAITYAKGEIVIGMFEAWMGPEAFRAGVRAYVAAHPYGVGSTTSFLDALGAQTGQPVRAAFESFLDQPGVPGVRFALDCAGPPTVRLTQGRFLPAEPGAAGTWQVPVCVRYPTEAGDRTTCTLLADTEGALPLETPTCPAYVVPDPDARGYYRTILDEAAFETLLDTPGALGPVERLALLGHGAALADAGLLEPSLLLERVPSLLALDQPSTTRTAAELVAGLDDHVITDALRPTYQRWVREQLGPVAARLGFDAVPGEPEEVALLRPLVLSVVGGEGADPELRAEALRRAPEVLRGAGVAPEVVGPTLRLAARTGDRALYDRMRAALDEDLPADLREAILGALPAFSDPELVASTLALAVEGGLDLRDRVPLLFGLYTARETRDEAWRLLALDPDRVADTIPGLFRKYVVSLGSGLCSPAHRAEVEALFVDRAPRYLGGPAMLDDVLQEIDVCLATTAKQRPGVETFLRSLD